MTAFATAEDLATHLRRDFDAADSATAAQALDGATQLIRAHLGQTVSAVADDVVELLSNGTNVLQLPETPVTDVSEVQERGAVLDPSLYYWTASGLLRRWGNSWPWWGTSMASATVQVTYDHGYATIPDDIHWVCLEVAARVFITTTGVEYQQFGEVSGTLGRGADQILAPALSVSDLDVLESYRLIRVG